MQQRAKSRNKDDDIHRISFPKISKLTMFWALIGGIMLLQQIPIAQAVYKDDPCETKGMPGVCKGWGDCPIIKTLIERREYTNREVVSCGFGIREELICCPVIRTETKIDDTTATPNICETKSQPGVCKKWSECPVIRTFIEDGQYTKHEVVRCGFDVLEEIICCPVIEIDRKIGVRAKKDRESTTTPAKKRDFWLDVLDDLNASTTTTTTTRKPDFWSDLLTTTRAPPTTTTTTTIKPLVIGNQTLDESSEYFDFSQLLNKKNRESETSKTGVSQNGPEGNSPVNTNQGNVGRDTFNGQNSWRGQQNTARGNSFFNNQEQNNNNRPGNNGQNRNTGRSGNSNQGFDGSPQQQGPINNWNVQNSGPPAPASTDADKEQLNQLIQNVFQTKVETNRKPVSGNQENPSTNIEDVMTDIFYIPSNNENPITVWVNNVDHPTDQVEIMDPNQVHGVAIPMHLTEEMPRIESHMDGMDLETAPSTNVQQTFSPAQIVFENLVNSGMDIVQAKGEQILPKQQQTSQRQRQQQFGQQHGQQPQFGRQPSQYEEFDQQPQFGPQPQGGQFGRQPSRQGHFGQQGGQFGRQQGHFGQEPQFGQQPFPQQPQFGQPPGQRQHVQQQYQFGRQPTQQYYEQQPQFGRQPSQQLPQFGQQSGQRQPSQQQFQFGRQPSQQEYYEQQTQFGRQPSQQQFGQRPGQRQPGHQQSQFGRQTSQQEYYDQQPGQRQPQFGRQPSQQEYFEQQRQFGRQPSQQQPQFGLQPGQRQPLEQQSVFGQQPSQQFGRQPQFGEQPGQPQLSQLDRQPSQVREEPQPTPNPQQTNSSGRFIQESPNGVQTPNVQSPPATILDPFKPFEFRPPPEDEIPFDGDDNSISPTPATAKPTPTIDMEERPAVRACNRIVKGLKAGLTPHILGGIPSELGEFPHMAAIGYGRLGDNGEGPYDIRCGGTLIDSRFVLTAAHCVASRDSTPAIVRMGAVNFTDPNELREAVEIRIKQTHIHNEYSQRRTYNDIAILELERAVTYSEYIYPICLYTDESDPKPEVKLWVSGWGTVNTSTRAYSDILLKAPLHVTPLERCNSSFIDYGLTRQIDQGIIRSQLCAEDTSQVKDACQGDSGGPLLMILDESYKNYRLVGVVSSGFGCASSTPGLYTRVAAFLNFVEQIVWPDGGGGD